MSAETKELPDAAAGLSAVLVACLEALDRGEPLDRQHLLARYPSSRFWAPAARPS
jgi:hypothetical protein